MLRYSGCSWGKKYHMQQIEFLSIPPTIVYKQNEHIDFELPSYFSFCVNGALV